MTQTTTTTISVEVGDVVLYTNLGDRDGKFPPEKQAAIITGLNPDGSCSLHVFYRAGQFDMPSVFPTTAVPGSEEARGMWSQHPRLLQQQFHNIFR